MNFRRMDIVVIQYQMVIDGSPNNNAWRMPVLDWNDCLGVRSLVIVGWARSPILTVGAVEQRNRGKDAVALESHLLLPQSIFFIIVRKLLIFYYFRTHIEFIGADDGLTFGSGFI